MNARPRSLPQLLERSQDLSPPQPQSPWRPRQKQQQPRLHSTARQAPNQQGPEPQLWHPQQLLSQPEEPRVPGRSWTLPLPASLIRRRLQIVHAVVLCAAGDESSNAKRKLKVWRPARHQPR